MPLYAIKMENDKDMAQSTELKTKHIYQYWRDGLSAATATEKKNKKRRENKGKGDTEINEEHLFLMLPHYSWIREPYQLHLGWWGLVRNRTFFEIFNPLIFISVEYISTDHLIARTDTLPFWNM